MTAQKAKKLSLEVWRFMAEHPETSSKYDLPAELFCKIIWYTAKCPLCELFSSPDGCVGCPLKFCDGKNALYYKWNQSITEETRKKYAQKIVDAIEAWKPEEQ